MHRLSRRTHAIPRFALMAAVFAAWAAVAPGAHAQAPEDDSGLRTSCVGDYFNFCAAYMPGSSAIRQCFIRSFPQLSAGCQAAIRAFDRRAGRRS